VCLYMHDPREPHFATLNRILRYVRGTVDFGFQLYAFATTSLVGYTDAEWVAKRQHTLSRYNAKAKYHGVSNVVAETAWLRNLLRELHSPISTATLVYCDNVRVLHVPSRYQLEFSMYFLATIGAGGGWTLKLDQNSSNKAEGSHLVKISAYWCVGVSLIGSGGMPPSHSAAVTALVVTVGLNDGLGGSIFAAALILACIVMYDATSEGLHAGHQAEVLN
nr:ribonuclease H-like domain-containing protein [Tanacetum cinerariifolium]